MGHQSYVLLCNETTFSNPPVVFPKSSCDVHLLRRPWFITYHQSKHLAALFDKVYSSSQIWVAKDYYKTHHMFDIFVLGHMGLVEDNCFGKLCHWYHCLITFQNHCLLFHFLNVCFVNLQRFCIKVHIFWEGQKILWNTNLHLTFVLYSASQK